MISNMMTRRLSAPLALVLALSLAGCGVFGGKGKPATPTVGNRVPILSKVDTSAKVDPSLAAVAVVVVDFGGERRIARGTAADADRAVAAAKAAMTTGPWATMSATARS